MGGSTSVELPHIAAFDTPNGTRAIMNAMLTYMITNLTIKEFVALSDSATCKQYVLFKANLISKYFYELRILPYTDGKSGVIAFRKATDLTDLSKDGRAANEKQSLCLILSYFYTRIFQIYGALALTLIEDVKATAENALQMNERGARFVAPGYEMRQLSYSHTGGAFTSDNSNEFFVFKELLATPDGNETNYVLNYTTFDKTILYFKYVIKDEYGRTSDPHGEFTIKYTDLQRSIVLPLRSSKIKNKDRFAFTFGNIVFSLKDKQETIKIPTEFTKFTIQDPDSSNINIVKSDNTIIPLLTFFKELFDIIVPELKRKLEGSRNTTSKDTIPHLGIGSILMGLQRDRPLGHCVARAMQLLKSPIFGNPDVTRMESFVCKAKFIPRTAGDWDAGLPGPSKKITDSPGIKALDDLFFDAIPFMATVSPQLGISPQSSAQYKAFHDRMSTLFEGQRADKKSTDEIYSTKDRSECSSSTGPTTITAIKQIAVLEVYKKLILTQRAHAKACGTIFAKLFQFGKNTVSLNPFIIQQGFPAIASINAAARQVLINYYTNCEGLYVQGRDIVLAKPQQLPQPNPQLPQPNPKLQPNPSQFRQQNPQLQPNPSQFGQKVLP